MQGETAEPGAFPDTPISSSSTAGGGNSRPRGRFSALGIEGIRLVAIAKGPDRNAGRETFFVEGRESFKLTPRDPALFFIQRLRDEAHRFAVGTHRARRKKEFVKSPLDEIPGIGPARKRALLSLSARPRTSRKLAYPISKRRPASTLRRRNWSTTSSTRTGRGDSRTSGGVKFAILPTTPTARIQPWQVILSEHFRQPFLA